MSDLFNNAHEKISSRSIYASCLLSLSLRQRHASTGSPACISSEGGGTTLQPLATAPAPAPEMKFNSVQSKEANVPSHVGPDALHPDPSKTPGLADTLLASDLTKRYSDHCAPHKETFTYSQYQRDVAKAVHMQKDHRG